MSLRHFSRTVCPCPRSYGSRLEFLSHNVINAASRWWFVGPGVSENLPDGGQGVLIPTFGTGSREIARSAVDMLATKRTSVFAGVPWERWNASYRTVRQYNNESILKKPPHAKQRWKTDTTRPLSKKNCRALAPSLPPLSFCATWRRHDGECVKWFAAERSERHMNDTDPL